MNSRTLDDQSVGIYDAPAARTDSISDDQWSAAVGFFKGQLAHLALLSNRPHRDETRGQTFNRPWKAARIVGRK